MKNSFYLVCMTLFLFISCSEDTPNPVGTNDDTTAPSAVTDLTVGFIDAQSATLYLTATGDDGLLGKAMTYEVRYSTSLINAGNYTAATQFAVSNRPNVGGVNDTIIVTGLNPNTSYYFAVKVADEIPNWSEISNIDTATTLLSGTWTTYNIDNSDLLSNDILSIEFDGNTKYIATTEGVSTFVNNTWATIYDSSSIDFIVDTIVEIIVDTAIVYYDTTYDTSRFSPAYSIAIESSSKVWLGTQNSGVALIEGDSAVFYTSNDSGTITSTRDILISGNKLWVGTSTNGLHSFTLDGSNIWDQYDIPRNPPTPGNGSIICLGVDASNDLWIGLDISGVKIFNNGILTNESITVQSIWDISASGSQMILGADNGVFIFDNNSWINYTTIHGLPDNAITSVVKDSQGILWCGTRLGLASFDGLDWTIYTTSNSFLPDNWINSLNVDMFGDLWIGTTNGLARFSN